MQSENLKRKRDSLLFNVSRFIAEDNLDCLVRCKQLLSSSLKKKTNFQHLEKEENQIRSRLVSAFDRRVSTSIIVIGPIGCGKKEIVEKVMSKYCLESIKSNQAISVARINGLVHITDNQAIMSLADQFLFRPNSYDRNVNIAHEDLENHFRVSFITGYV